MITSIRNIDISSAILKKELDNNTGKTSNSVHISVSYEGDLSKNDLRKHSLRLFVCSAENSMKVMDYLFQRHSEFLNGLAGSTQELAYVNYLQQALGEDSGYISTSSPFSPYSTNIEARNLVITDNVSIYGKGNIIPEDVVIYDINLDTATMIREGNKSILQMIRIDLQDTDGDLENLSCHCFVYDNQMPEIFADDAVNNLALNTGMTLVSRRTFIGTQTSFLNVSPQNPFVGMREAEKTTSPDEDRLKTLEQDPGDVVVDRYTSIINKVSRTFETNRAEKNYEINKILNKQNYFTDFWMTKDNDENNRFIFSFDLKTYLAENSIYPFVYANDFLSNAVINGGTDISPDELSSVVSTQVFRNTIRNSGVVAVNNLGTTGPGATSGDFTNTETIPVPEVKEVSLNLPNGSGIDSSSPVVFYEGCDKFSTDLRLDEQISGKYQYSVKCTIRDNSPEMMRKLSNLLYGLKVRVSLVYDYIVADSSVLFGNNPAYNLTTGRLNRSINSILLNLGDEQVSAGSEILDVLSTYEQIVNALSQDNDPVNLVSFYQNRFEAEEGRIDPIILKEIEMVLDLGIRFVQDNLAKVFPSDPFGRHQNANRTLFAQNASRSTRQNTLVAEHRFMDIFEKGKSEGFGVDYIFNNDAADQFRTINVSNFTERRQEEFRKYFFTTNGSAVLEPEGTYEDSSFAYFTPKTIKTPGRQAIDQPSFATEATSIDYDFDRYGQLYADLVSLYEMSRKTNAKYATLESPVGKQSRNNKNYASIKRLLEQEYGVSIKEDVVPQFSSPQIMRGKRKHTLYNLRDRENCGPNGGLMLLQSIIGGENTQSSTTKNYFSQSDNKIKEESFDLSKGSTDTNAIKNDLKDRAIRLPFVILGELTLNKEIIQQSRGIKNTFNSLSEFRKILDISEKNINQKIDSEIFGLLPNQLKNMVIVTSTINDLSLGNGDGSLTFDARRFNLNEEPVEEGADLVSFYDSDQRDSGIYSLAEDPMKTYARFLTFWMNYRQIAVVEYLDGFASLENINENDTTRNTRYKLSNWRTLTPDLVQQIEDGGGSILCRVRSMKADDYLQILGNNLSAQQKNRMINYLQEKEVLDLPTYNQYFYISNEVEVIETDTEEEILTNVSAQQAAQTAQDFRTGY